MLSGAEVLRTADYGAGRKTGIGVEASIDHAEHRLLRWCLSPRFATTTPHRHRNGIDISADVILAKELKRLICRWHAFVKGIDSGLVQS